MHDYGKHQLMLAYIRGCKKEMPWMGIGCLHRQK